MSILFASPTWPDYKNHFKLAFKKNNLDSNDLTNDLQTNSLDIEFIIYDPKSKLKNFLPFKNAKAVLNLWAGVDEIVQNKTLNKPLIRLVDKGLTQGMVEWCIAHVLRHHLGIDIHIKNQDGVWRSNIIPSLADEITVGILGLGTLGGAVGKALAEIGFRVVGWSQTKKSISNIESYTELTNLKKVLQSSQILITLLPLTPQTKYILNASTLKLLPRNSVLINPGRGLLIKDDDLIKLLDSGHIRHATLDVFSEEPLKSSHPYWKHPHVTVTPHIAAHTRPRSSAETITDSLIRIRRGETPVGLVDRTKMY